MAINFGNDRNSAISNTNGKNYIDEEFMTWRFATSRAAAKFEKPSKSGPAMFIVRPAPAGRMRPSRRFVRSSKLFVSVYVQHNDNLSLFW